MSSNNDIYISDDTFRVTGADGVMRDFRRYPDHFWIGKSTSHELCPPHIHNYMQLWYVLNDSCIQNFNGISYVQKRGDFLIVPPFFQHNIDTRSSQDIQFVFCEFSTGFVSDILSSDKNSLFFNFMYLKPLLATASLMDPLLTFDINTTSRIEVILNELLSEYQKISDFSLSFIRMRITKLLTILIEEYEKRSTAEDAKLYSKYRTSIKHAQAYIDEHYKQNIRLNDVCKIAMMSVSAFSCIFKLSTGKSFTEYLNYLRVSNARYLLSHTDSPVTDICLECGFYDAAYFNKVFKRLTGITPGAYRKHNSIK